MSDFNSIDWMAQQNGGQFDPELFGDYRDPQDNILSAEFGGFFSDAFPVQDFTSPFYTGDITTPAPKRDLMQEVENQKNGNDDVGQAPEKPKNLLKCNQLWYALQNIQTTVSPLADHIAPLQGPCQSAGKGARGWQLRHRLSVL